MKKLKVSGTNESIYYEKLTTGLDVYMYPNDKVQSFYLTYNVKYGSTYNDIKIDGSDKKISFPFGTAHFLEHQLFQNGDGKNAFQEFSLLGSSVNAYTSYDVTCYEVISSTLFKENLETLYKFVNTPAFDEKSIENEKKIIASEIDMYKNSPGATATFGIEYNLNINDPHKYTISGEKSDIEKIDEKTLNRAYNTFYSHENSFIVITGAFHPLEALGLLKECVKTISSIPSKKFKKINKKEPLKVSIPKKIVEMDIDNKKVNYAFKIDKKPFEKYDTFLVSTCLNILLDIIYSSSSDFYENCVNEHIIDKDFSYSCEIRDDYIKIGFNYSSEYIDESLEMIKDNFLNNSFDKDDVERIKKVYIASYIRSFDDILSIQESIASDILDTGKINLGVLDEYSKINFKMIKDMYDKITISDETIFIVEPR